MPLSDKSGLPSTLFREASVSFFFSDRLVEARSKIVSNMHQFSSGVVYHASHHQGFPRLTFAAKHRTRLFPDLSASVQNTICIANSSALIRGRRDVSIGSVGSCVETKS